MGANPRPTKPVNAAAELSDDRIPNDEIGDFAEGQERTHHNQHPRRFSEGEESLPEKDNYVGDFAEGQEAEHDRHIGTFAVGQETEPS
jgi:hypothetical protein